MQPVNQANATRDMATPGRVLRQLVRTVPQWYEADFGKYSYSLALEWETLTFHSSRELTPNLERLYAFAKDSLTRWTGFLPNNPRRTFFAQLRQTMAIRWLSLVSAEVNWTKIINYLEELSFRTYENIPISVNLIVSPGETGSVDLGDPEAQKIFNTLTSSQFTFLKVDGELRYVDFMEIEWDEVKVESEYKFNPEFLQPLISALQTHEYGVHLSKHGDIVFVSKEGMVASFRKGEWFIYDSSTFRNCIADALGPYWVGCNIYQVLFDLSYKRHGALLIFDPHDKVINQIVNTESLLDENYADSARRHLMSTVRDIAVGSAKRERSRNRMLVELASLDGAVVFNGENIKAFGSMIRSHEAVGSYVGARTTAAFSAFLHGGMPIKISADGEVTILFHSEDQEGNVCAASMEFM